VRLGEIKALFIARDLILKNQQRVTSIVDTKSSNTPNGMSFQPHQIPRNLAYAQTNFNFFSGSWCLRGSTEAPHHKCAAELTFSVSVATAAMFRANM